MRKERHAGTQKCYRNAYFRVTVLPGKGVILAHVLLIVMCGCLPFTLSLNVNHFYATHLHTVMTQRNCEAELRHGGALS